LPERKSASGIRTEGWRPGKLNQLIQQLRDAIYAHAGALGGEEPGMDPDPKV